MAKKKLLKKLRQFFDARLRKQLKHQAELKKVLKQLRSKERKIAAKLEHTSDFEIRQQLQLELGIMHAHRKKGIKALAALRTRGS